jgi:hypothetical protein
MIPTNKSKPKPSESKEHATHEKPMKIAVWMDGLPGNPIANIYMSPLWARQKTTLPLALKL